jgi:MFS family permease
VGGLVLLAAGMLLAGLWPVVGALLVAAVLAGAGVGLATPLAFAHLASSTPPDRMGRTMGSAELGRELGDAGGPLVAGAVATATVPGVGLVVIGGLTAGAGILAALGLRRVPDEG